MAGFGARLKEAMDLRGLNETELGALIGVKQSSISDMLRRDGPSKHVVALARELDVSPDWLAYGLGPIARPPALPRPMSWRVLHEPRPPLRGVPEGPSKKE